MDDRTQQLDLTAPIPTGNIKAAAAAAGATSADLWMVPYEQLHYDPADNVRAVDAEWVAHLAALMRENGYDKGSPLHCYARKVDGKDLLYVYKGQHRYLAAGHVIATGKNLGKIPVVVRDAKNVNRAEMVIDGYLSNNNKPSSPLDLAASVAELRDIHGMSLAAICKRLNVTDQTIRDVGLLERAPAELHQLVRDGQCTGTLAIEQIRQHGGDKALERIVVGISKAAEAGKTKVTKKYLDAAPLLDALPEPTSSADQTTSAATTNDATPPAASTAADATVATPAPARVAPHQSAPAKINEKLAKQLLQALQAVRQDPVFGKLSPGTVDAVHAALAPLADLLDATPARKTAHTIATANEHGVYAPTDVIAAPKQQRTGRCPAEIRVALIAEGVWIYGMDYTIGMAGGASPCTYHEGMPTHPTRVQAIRGAVRDLTRRIEASPVMSKAKETDSVRKWLDKLYAMPDPDWTPEMALETPK
ncbi:pyridoxal phosphate biosynthetic protein PdxJ [Burkholderia sp. Ac-20384]|uniref:ParB/RepB/Spo0J family partition protein n=1 Tax=Burkholderia sp. Ac-20384 TaxID=2703902 RepID=UPI00197F2226|nr:pyridoxal phosphate biosynthetic protein PdxJ [Burkholderia sp. Ac-20384]MBN3823849.1 pyridoxal phosphate biosynthetic protein PdxJ [Burkholderia sp. Ac-20384]